MADRDETVPQVAAMRELALEGDAAVGTPVGIPPRTTASGYGARSSDG